MAKLNDIRLRQSGIEDKQRHSLVALHDKIDELKRDLLVENQFKVKRKFRI